MENKVNNFPFPQHRENYASLNGLRAFAEWYKEYYRI